MGYKKEESINLKGRGFIKRSLKNNIELSSEISLDNSLSILQKFVGRGEVKGFKFTQLIKTNKAFLYKVDSGNSIYFEVFKMKLNKRCENISYPTSKAFGIWAWTYMTLELAIDKFNKLDSDDGLS